MDTPSQPYENHLPSRSALLIILVVFALAVVGFTLIGSPPPVAAVSAVAFLALSAGLIAGAYVVAGVGIGRAISHTLRKSFGCEVPVPIQVSLGLGAIVWLSHLLGVLGLLSGPRGQWIAWAVVALGVLLVIAEFAGFFGSEWKLERLHPPSAWWMLAAPAVALLLVAASNPPAALWLGPESEAGAYDVQSYHLQLPKEWVAGADQGGEGRLRPLPHNVYSYLPGYMEAAFLHVAAMTGGGKPSGGDFVSGSGTGVIAAQYLHAAFGIAAMLALAAGVRSIVTRAAPSPRSDRDGLVPGIIAGAALISVPWVTVVGSLAYNELAVVAMLVAATALAFERVTPSDAPRSGALRSRTLVRGITIGFLAGIACSAKPTALFLGAPVVGIVLLFDDGIPLRQRLVTVLWGILGGTVAIAPWLLRNYLTAGNPVFPFLHSFFGDSHWTPDQFVRYAQAHAFEGGLLHRVGLLFSTTRGVFHHQWSILFPIGVVALIGASLRPSTRRAAIMLLCGLVLQLIAWLFLTHLQSRFLIPALVPLCLGIGLGVHALIEWIGARNSGVRRAGETAPSAPARSWQFAGLLVASLAPLSLVTWSAQNFAAERGGNPNGLLVLGVEALTGRMFAAELAQMNDELRERTLREQGGPLIATNFRVGPTDALYMVGAATPLYYLPAGGSGIPNVWYNTTWDNSPLGDAVRAHPTDPRDWTAAVRDAMRRRMERAGKPLSDVYVLLDMNEIARLHPTEPGKPIWFDPVLTREVVSRWMKEQGTLIQSWPDPETDGVFLFKLKGTP